MYNKIKNMWGIFKDNNDWNEKNVVGFIAFLVMVVFALFDLITGYVGKDLVINEFIYVSCCVCMGFQTTRGPSDTSCPCSQRLATARLL